jgi:phosphoenolpyruvate-protein phosphotransferase (PTS system enzyme I)
MQFNGLPASPGFCNGKIFIIKKEKNVSEQISINKTDTEKHINKFYEARKKTKMALENTYETACKKIGSDKAEIFLGYIDILLDEEIEEGVIEEITENLVPIETAISRVFKNIAEEMGEIDDPYFKGRIADMNDIGKQLLDSALGKQTTSLETITEPVILVADDITPSEMIKIDLSKVFGFITEEGGITSHVAIIARSKELPAIVGTDSIIDRLKDSDTVILNAVEGTAIFNPNREELKTFAKQKAKYIKEREELLTDITGFFRG